MAALSRRRICFVIVIGLMAGLSGCLGGFPLGSRATSTHTAAPATHTAAPTSTRPISPPDTATPPATATPTPLPPTMRVTGDFLNVRAGPSTETEIIARLQQGTMLPVLGRNAAGDWVMIRLGNGQEAWVSVEWIELPIPVESLPIAENIPAIPTPTPAPGTPTPTAQPSPAATPTPLPAPALLSPPDGQAFGAAGPGQMAWSWQGTLQSDWYFVVTIAYPHEEAIWYDTHWVKETTFSPPSYLKDLITGDRRCVWHVTVMRQTGVNEQGWPVGEPVSYPSAQRSFVWGN